MIRVLVVDDEPIMAEAHGLYVQRLEGFELAGICFDGQSTLHFIAAAATAGNPIDVLLLDMNLPDLHGLEVASRLRSSGLPVDIIAITAVRELPVVRRAISVGVVQYLIKPFGFPAFAEKLGNYRQFREQLEASPAASQEQVDQALASLRTPVLAELPKGLSAGTLEAVVELLKSASLAVSAQEVTERLGISRVTARRYLEYLADRGSARRTPRYGTPGRPENEYHWI
ncbi:response regulator of citrate/malate metabolism [Psychromicrobium silvestre]|uniref:Transcriptional regulatory protein n=1 Tax=Psychromicrobium silvestre TaxID=1645614 RepID=A0A7Y9LQR6_9MICC|nr:response regulator [Psychromicrobium silvestre]NYE93852.1 response regulator of citrate/malate metabolism [Psychromicrobium silvestre]